MSLTEDTPKLPAALPQLSRVQNMHLTCVLNDSVVHVLRSAGSIACLAVPQTDKMHLPRTPGQGRVELPQVVPCIWGDTLWCGPQHRGHFEDCRVAVPFHVEVFRNPVFAGETHGLVQESRFCERDAD